MIKHLTTYRNWLRLVTRPHQVNVSDRIVISSDARVSLNQEGAAFLHARSGAVFTSNRIGARIWQGLLDHENVETIAARFSLESGVEHNQVRRETAEFVAELEVHGFLSRGIGC